MSRPEHLHCVNTVAGIDRINENQRHYDADPEAYEAAEKAEKERREEEQYWERQQEQEWREREV